MLHNFAFKKRLHHLCAAAIAIFSYLLSGDECKAVIKTLESKSPAITPSNGQHQTAGMFCQMSRKLHKITDHRTYSSAMYFLPAGSILLFQRFLPYDSKDIICDHCQLQHQFVALKLSQRESFNIPTDVTGNDTAGMVAGMVASGMTAKGLNGIEAEANKLAKAPKGIDGVTEGAGNLAEDVGKAGKGLEGAAKGAESAAEDAGKVVESGKKTIISTLGNEIDITPSLKHTSVNKNPGPYGEVNTSVDILDAEGNIKTRRWYDSEGKAYRDVDMSDHGNPKEHPEVPHEHTWEYNNGKPKRN